MAALQAPAPPAATPAWQFLGPSVITNGQTYGNSRVPVSGRVAAVAVDPSNANHVLVGGAGGGVWESADAGTTWAPRTDGMPTLATGAIAFDPTSPLTVYAGTGEGNWYSFLGQGVLRSTNGGTTWSLLVGAPFVGQGFFALVVDPANGQHLLGGTTGGIYTSTNGGVTWSQTHPQRAWDLSMSPGGGPTAEILAASKDGLFSSTDGGATWSAVALPGAPGSWDRLAVGHAKSNPAVAYAFGASGATAYLWRRSGGAWTSFTPPAGLSTGQAWYDWFVAAAPDTDAQVYLGAIDAYRGDLAGATWTWTDISSKPTADTSPGVYHSIHPDQHAIAFSPTDPATIYVGCDGGLFHSADRGATWSSLNNGLGITEVEYIAQNPTTASWVLAGTQDNGSIRYTGTTVWEHVADGDGGDCGVNLSTPNTCFHSFYGMGLERSTAGGGSGSWNWIGPNVPTTYARLFYPPMGVDGDTLAQAGQSVFISRDNGTNWTEVALPANLVASAISVPTSDHVYAATTSGRVFRIDWTGAAWSAAVELTSPRSAWISSLYVDPGNRSRIWTTSSWTGGGRVFRSDDGGASWRDLTLGLPNLPINAVEVNPSYPNRVWVGADVGVYQSLDAGSTWAPMSLGLPNALVEDLAFQPQAQILRAGTRNRGVWQVAPPPPVRVAGRLGCLTVMDTPTASQRPYAFVLGSDTHLWVNWWDGSNWHWADQGLPGGGTIAGSVGVITVMDNPTASQRPYVFVRGIDSHLWVNWWDGTRWHWADQGNPSGAIVSDGVGAVTVKDNPTASQRPYAFVIGGDGHLWVNWWDGSNWHWADQGMPGTARALASGVGAITVMDNPTASQRPYAFVIDTDSRLWVNWWDGANWRWADQGMPAGVGLVGAGAITVMDNPTASQRPYAFVWGSDRHLWVNWWDGANWHWADQGTPPGVAIMNPAGVTTVMDNPTASQRPYAFVWGSDGHLWVNWWDGANWRWADQGTPPTTFAGGQGAITVKDNPTASQRPYAFIVGGDGHLWVNWWDGANWHWADQGTPAG